MTEWVQKAKLHDQDAWNRIYEQTCKEVYFIALKITNHEEDAWDLLQDTYFSAFQSLSMLEDPQKLRSWLNTIAANKCRDYLRKKKPALFSDLEQDDGKVLDWEDPHENVLPDQVLDHKETVRLVQQIIGDLPDDQKLCLLLYYREEMSVGEIAHSLGVSDGTVKSRLNYARQKVKAKVLELEKQGTKLYGLAPLPFLLWLLRAEAEAVTVPALPAVAAAATATATIANTTASASTAHTILSGIKVLFSTTTAKIAVSVILAGSVGAGAIAIHHAAETRQPLPETPPSVQIQMDLTGVEHDHAGQNTSSIEEALSAKSVKENDAAFSESLPQDETASAERENEDVTEEAAAPVQEDTEVIVPAASEEEIALAYKAFNQLLEAGVTEHHFPIRYYAYVDLDNNGVPEMLVQNVDEGEAWCFLQLMVYEDGAVHLRERFSHSETAEVHLVNNEYLRIASTGYNQWSAIFYSLNDAFRISEYVWSNGQDIYQPTIFYDDSGSHGYQSRGFENVPEPNIQKVALTENQFAFYRCLPDVTSSNDCFAQSFEEIIFHENHHCTTKPTRIDAESFSLLIPPHWEGIYEARVESDSIGIYEKSSAQQGYGGHTVTVFSHPVGEELLGPMYILGVLTSHPSGIPHYLCYWHATDIQFADDKKWEYIMIDADCWNIADLIIADYTPLDTPHREREI